MHISEVHKMESEKQLVLSSAIPAKQFWPKKPEFYNYPT
jgi:hypothetical protein